MGHVNPGTRSILLPRASLRVLLNVDRGSVLNTRRSLSSDESNGTIQFNTHSIIAQECLPSSDADERNVIEARLRMTQHLYEKYYFSKPGYTGGTKPFFDICAAHIPRGSEILEIGSGPSNPTTKTLAQIGPVTGVDINAEVLGNNACVRAEVFDGLRLPFPDNSFDSCVSNWVLEHVADPSTHFKEVGRVLRPGGTYCFRTPNLFHYVMMGSRLTPHFLHLG